MRRKASYSFLMTIIVLVTVGMGTVSADVGEPVHQITVPVSGVSTHCSVGLTFDGENLYYDRCSDSNIYIVDPMSGSLVSTFNTNIPENPNALAYDQTRNGIWIGTQSCNGIGSPIYFWDLDDNTVSEAFTIPSSLTNPANGESFLTYCFIDGLAFNAQSSDVTDDELWISDDAYHNLGLFSTDGTLIEGYDTRNIHADLATNSGLAIGGKFLYMGNNGGGQVFRANINSVPLSFDSVFTNGDGRQEDLACDSHTFAPREVMWVRTTPQSGTYPDVITAYEIEAGSCGIGGVIDDPDDPPPPTAPEPMTIVLFGSGIAAFGTYVRKMRRNKETSA